MRPSRASAIARIESPHDAQPELSDSTASETHRSAAVSTPGMEPRRSSTVAIEYQRADCSEGLAPVPSTRPRSATAKASSTLPSSAQPITWAAAVDRFTGVIVRDGVPPPRANPLNLDVQVLGL